METLRIRVYLNLILSNSSLHWIHDLGSLASFPPFAKTNRSRVVLLPNPDRKGVWSTPRSRIAPPPFAATAGAVALAIV